MKPLKSISNPLIAGTLLLTVTGLSNRVIGFFYRIFLSRIIGAEGLGIYQLIFPIYMLCFSLCCHGLPSVPQASRPLSPVLLLQLTIKIPA